MVFTVKPEAKMVGRCMGEWDGMGGLSCCFSFYLLLFLSSKTQGLLEAELPNVMLLLDFFNIYFIRLAQPLK